MDMAVETWCLLNNVAFDPTKVACNIFLFLGTFAFNDVAIQVFYGLLGWEKIIGHDVFSVVISSGIYAIYLMV